MVKPQTDIELPTNNTDSYVSMALGLAVVLVIGIFIYNFTTKKQSSQSANTAQNQNKNDSPEGVSSPTSHTVAKGETLWSIAETYYKSGYNWTDIAKANNLTNANDIELGQTLTIPVANPILPAGNVTAQAAQMDKPKDSSYTVTKGDTLWAIATREYGNGYKWAEIARANKLANPDIIHPGNVLMLP